MDSYKKVVKRMSRQCSYKQTTFFIEYHNTNKLFHNQIIHIIEWILIKKKGVKSTTS